MKAVDTLYRRSSLRNAPHFNDHSNPSCVHLFKLESCSQISFDGTQRGTNPNVLKGCINDELSFVTGAGMEGLVRMGGASPM